MSRSDSFCIKQKSLYVAFGGFPKEPGGVGQLGKGEKDCWCKGAVCGGGVGARWLIRSWQLMVNFYLVANFCQDVRAAQIFFSSQLIFDSSRRL